MIFFTAHPQTHVPDTPKNRSSCTPLHPLGVVWWSVADSCAQIKAYIFLEQFCVCVFMLFACSSLAFKVYFCVVAVHVCICFRVIILKFCLSLCPNLHSAARSLLSVLLIPTPQALPSSDSTGRSPHQLNASTNQPQCMTRWRDHVHI